MTDRTHSGQVVEELLAVARLLREPGLARLYTHVLCAGEVTIEDIVDALDLPRARVISETDTAVELGMLARIDDRPDHRFTASPILLSVEVDGEIQTVTPTLIDAIGRAPGDQDLQLLLDCHGFDTLAVALSYAIPYAEGTMSERSLDLARRASEAGVDNGCRPTGVAAACVYRAAREHDERVTQAALGELADVSAMTIQAQLNKIRAGLGASDHERAQKGDVSL